MEHSWGEGRAIDAEHGQIGEMTPEQEATVNTILAGSELENATFGDEENTPTSTNYSPQN